MILIIIIITIVVVVAAAAVITCSLSFVCFDSVILDYFNFRGKLRQFAELLPESERWLLSGRRGLHSLLPVFEPRDQPHALPLGSSV